MIATLCPKLQYLNIIFDFFTFFSICFHYATSNLSIHHHFLKKISFLLTYGFLQLQQQKDPTDSIISISHSSGCSCSSLSAPLAHSFFQTHCCFLLKYFTNFWIAFFACFLIFVHLFCFCFLFSFSLPARLLSTCFRGSSWTTHSYSSFSAALDIFQIKDLSAVPGTYVCAHMTLSVLHSPLNSFECY